MADAVEHRGPDGFGVWCDVHAGFALSHRRLAIIDLTPTGAQPMLSADGRWVISYNGEVYNPAAIAREPELAGVPFRGTSDTEVILESMARRGLDRTLADLNGMFAFAIWDRAQRTVHLVRDRLGIKPLFFARVEGVVWFASELKSFAAISGLRFEIDSASLTSFLRLGYVPAPWSIFKGVSKVMPGEIVSIGPDGNVTRRRYWSLAEVAAVGMADPFEGTDADAETALHDLIAEAVSGQMVSDVPIGALLSGGIDSSTVAALMVAAGRGSVRTFSIGFPDFGFDESKYAAAVARHLGTDHTALTISGADALAVVPKLVDIYDEPFADSSQVPTYLVSKLARSHVTVALSGDGGDELFAGYDRYSIGEGLITKLSYLPVGIRRAAAAFLRAIPDGATDWIARVAPRGMVPDQFTHKLKKIADMLPSDRETMYFRFVSQCPEPGALSRGSPERLLAFDQHSDFANRSFLARMQLFDTATYLPDDILHKVDRASMAVSLEVRPPLLDHRVVALAWRLPRRFHIRNGETKWLLRRVLHRYVPRQLVDRPKMGFAVPLANWLSGPLRDWAEDLLDPARLGGGFLDVDAVRLLWATHLQGRRNWAYALWTVMMFEAWRRRWANG